MVRRTVEVLAVGPEHHALLLDLWASARAELGLPNDGGQRAAFDRLHGALERPDVRAWIALVDAQPAGFVVTSQNPFGLSQGTELAIEQLHVVPPARRTGVARAMLAQVLAYAERTGCEVIVSNVPATSKDANRFFARLGFGSVLVRRVVTASVLRRRLDPEVTGSRLEVIRRRRTLRARAGV